VATPDVVDGRRSRRRTPHLRLEADPSAPSAARRFVAEAVGDGFPDERVDELVLLVSEVVTNAVFHAQTQLEVRVDVFETHVSVQVRDFNDARPATMPDVGAHGGWGLRLLDQLALRWGVNDEEPGKTVWFEVASR
jgi:anti-sigma regulatory factor (Ser/Thr protein kinase)